MQASESRAPLHVAEVLAAKANSLSFVDMLIEHGADPNVRTDDDGTAVSFAAQYGFEEVLVRLLKAGGDPLLENKIGQNARARALGKPPRAPGWLKRAPTSSKTRFCSYVGS